MKSIQTIQSEAGAALRRRGRMRSAFLKGAGGLALLFLILGLGAITASPETDLGTKTMSASVIGLGAIVGAGGVREKEDEPGGGGGGTPSDPTQKLLAKIDKNIAEAQTRMKEIESKAADVPELKKELEALQKVVSNFKGLDQNVKGFVAQSKALETKLARIRVEENGDPLKRILADEEKVFLLTAPARASYLRHHNKAVSKETEDAAERMTGLMEARVLSDEATPGSNYVDDELMSDVYQLVAMYGIWSNFDVLRPSAGTAKLPVDTSDPVAKWVTSRGTAESESGYAGTSVNLLIEDLIAWLAVNNSLLEDDNTGLASRLLTKFSRANSSALDFVSLQANGGNDTTDGGFNGIFDAGTAFTLGTGDVAFSDVTFDDFVELQAGADEALVGAPDTRWALHPQVLVRFLGIKDDNGRPIFQTALEAPSPTAIGSILGDGVLRSNQAPKAAGAGLPFAAYGDLKALAVAIRKDMEFTSSGDAQFTANNTVFRSVMRAGVKLRQATAWEVMTFAAS